MADTAEYLKLAAGLGSLIALVKSGFSYLRDRSLDSRRDEELSKALVAADFSGKPRTTLATDVHKDSVEEIDISVRQHLRKLKVLSARLAERAADPVYKLSGTARFFLHFGKSNWRIRLTVSLTYLCAILAGIALIDGLAGWPSPKLSLSGLRLVFDHLLPFVILIGLSFLVCSWTLAEYRRLEGFPKSLGSVAQRLVLRPPETLRMFFARLLLFGYGWVWTATLLFALLEGGDLFRKNPWAIAFQLFIILSLVTFRNWPAAEFDLAKRPREVAAVVASRGGRIR